MGTIVWKVIGVGGSVLAGLVATKVVDAIWERVEHERINPKNPDAPLLKALTYAAATGLAVGTARTFVSRSAARYYRDSAGHLPKEIREKAA